MNPELVGAAEVIEVADRRVGNVIRYAQNSCKGLLTPRENADPGRVPTPILVGLSLTN